MSPFILLMAAGITGMVMMALPGLMHGHVGHIHIGHTHAGGHIAPHAATGAHTAHGAAAHHAGAGGRPQAEMGAGRAWFGGLIPSPRTIFSLLALYGAFGFAFVDGLHMTQTIAALAALVPAWGIERFLITPLWNMLFRYQAEPDTPLECLAFTEAKAVTPFSNGRGIVSVVRDGRCVQFSAHLIEEQAGMPIKVGERLLVENVDAEKERLTVRLG